MIKQVALQIDAGKDRCRKLRHCLNAVGFEVHRTQTSSQAREMLDRNYYSLVILDTPTLGQEVEAICSDIRAKCANTIIITLMAKCMLKLEEKLFDAGVNDVVVGQQATMRVLSKRIMSHLRHCRSYIPQSQVVRLNETLVSFSRKEVWCRGQIRKLPGISADLLKYFIDHPDRVITRDELLRSPIWADSICSSAEEGGKTFDMNMSKLRKIIEPDPTNPGIIQTVRGVGWKLAPECIHTAESADTAAIVGEEIKP